MEGAPNEVSSRPLRIIAAIGLVGALYLASDVLIPVALAILLAFVLNPIVLRLTRWRIKRPIAVAITICLAISIAGGVGSLVWRQVVELSHTLPEYRENLRGKVRSFRSTTDNAFGRVLDTFVDLKKEIATTQPTEVLKPEGFDLPSWLATSAVFVLTESAIVALLLIFLLLHSDDIRERLVWFAGMRQISLTTAALDEAGQRIAGYLRMQVLVNFSYGVMISIALSIVGLPSALLWGTLAGLLRFVPFVGPWVSSVLPLLVAIAISPGWRMPVEVVASFVVIELLTNMGLEPWLYGRSTGISSLGVVCAAIFWAWLWGPVGLILAVPLTVCLLVIGKQVPQLALLNHLFGESVEMPRTVRLYQRVLVGDDVTAGRVIDEELKNFTFSEACQNLFMPVLQEVKRDLQLGMIDLAQARRAMSILDVTTSGDHAAGSPQPTHAGILFVAAQNEVDDLAATLLARAAVSEGSPAQMLSSRALASEVVEHAREAGAATICLVQVAPISWIHFRHLARTLAARLPGATLYAVGIHASEMELPFSAETAQFPVKRIFPDVAALMARVHESTLLQADAPPVAPR